MAAKYLLVAALCLGMMACKTIPEDPYITSTPKTKAVRSMTSFSESLTCMDQMFASNGVRGFRITSIGIPDATGKVAAGTDDMLMSAVSRMTMRSQAFSYLDLQYQEQIIYLDTIGKQADVPVNQNLPHFYIRGAITQLDRNVEDQSVGGGLSYDNDDLSGDASAAATNTASVIALDMNIVQYPSKRVVPGLTASNRLAVRRKGKGADFAGLIEKVGISFSIDIDRSEGMHQAVRTLVELGAIELLGKLARVPYWECLQIESTHPEVLAEIRDWYASMSEKQRLLFVQRALVAGGYLQGEDAGTFDETTRKAIAKFETEHNMIPSGRIGFDLYRTLLGADYKIAAGPPKLDGAGKAPSPEEIAARAPLAITMLNERGANPTYKPGEEFRMSVQTSDNAYVYCYYADAVGNVARIFPNRFQPNSYVAGERLVEVPSREAPFAIQFDRPGAREEVACVASDRELGLHLPTELKGGDLQPLPVANLDGLLGQFEAIDPKGLKVGRLPINVSQ
jgi:hypothetical protein